MTEPSGRLTIRHIAPLSIELTNSTPDAGSNEPPPQLAPPFVPGNIIVQSGPMGRNIGPVTAPSISFWHSARDSGVTSVNSSNENVCRANGGGFTGNGCVREVCSPGITV